MVCSRRAADTWCCGMGLAWRAAAPRGGATDTNRGSARAQVLRAHSPGEGARSIRASAQASAESTISPPPSPRAPPPRGLRPASVSPSATRCRGSRTCDGPLLRWSSSKSSGAHKRRFRASTRIRNAASGSSLRQRSPLQDARDRSTSSFAEFKGGRCITCRGSERPSTRRQGARRIRRR